MLIPHQIAPIQNFEILTSRDDDICLEDSFQKKLALRHGNSSSDRPKTSKNGQISPNFDFGPL